MMFDAFLLLAQAGFGLREYQYTGFGSIFFVDFTLFHKYLGLSRMLTVEHAQEIRKRVTFNKPFNLVDVEFKAAAEVIPTLSVDRRHILWLDYDDHLQDWILQDLVSALTRLPVGSIILLTVDVEPPIRDAGPEEWETYYRQHAGAYIPHDWTTQEFGREKLASVVRTLLARAISSSLTYRQEVSFSPLFSFLYADGHEMYTIGGMLTSLKERRRLRQAAFDTAQYIRQDFDIEPYHIRVPNLTRKERLYLEAHMPSSPDWLPADFELTPEDLVAYRDIYRFYPHFAEVF